MNAETITQTDSNGTATITGKIVESDSTRTKSNKEELEKKEAYQKKLEAQKLQAEQKRKEYQKKLEENKKKLEEKPTKIMEEAVRNMLPNNKLRKHFMSKLKVFVGTEHPHDAQKPEELKI